MTKAQEQLLQELATIETEITNGIEKLENFPNVFKPFRTEFEAEQQKHHAIMMNMYGGSGHNRYTAEEQKQSNIVRELHQKCESLIKTHFLDIEDAIFNKRHKVRLISVVLYLSYLYPTNNFSKARFERLSISYERTQKMLSSLEKILNKLYSDDQFKYFQPDEGRYKYFLSLSEGQERVRQQLNDW